MRILVSGATASMNKIDHTPIAKHHLGRLYEPRGGHTINTNLPWACDNGAFTGFEIDPFLKMLDRAKADPYNNLFVAAPDVVGNHKLTLASFWEWYKELWKRDLRPAFVLQDGLIEDEIPWDYIGTVFVGGTTEFKMAPETRRICQMAKSMHNKRVHVGRVNSYERMRHWMGVADSIDGTQFSMYTDIYLPKALVWVSGLHTLDKQRKPKPEPGRTLFDKEIYNDRLS